MLNFFRNNFIGLVWSLLAVTLSVMPGKDLPEVDIVNFDKIAHLVFYALFYIAVRFGLQRNYAISVWKVQIYAFLYTSLFGLLMEFIQGNFTADRHFDWYDAIANVLGVILVAFMFSTITKLKYLFAKN
ncbi:MAG: VanZ family protein [Patiriisocius sp.]|jgi:VanZ family protein